MVQPSLFEEEAPTRLGRVEVRQVAARSILTPASGRLAAYAFSLRCGFARGYCYAAFFVPDEVRSKAWGTWVDVKTNALALLRVSKGLAGARIYLGSVTDPYQPLRDLDLLRRFDHLRVNISVTTDDDATRR